MAEREYNPNAVPDIISVYEAAKAKHIADAAKDFEDVSEPEDPVRERASPGDEQPAPPPVSRSGVRMRQDTFTLDEGTVTIQWPERLSKASYADLRDWLEIMGRKIERAVPRDDEANSEA